MACGTVTAEVQYLKRLGLYETEKPFQLFFPVDKNSEDCRTTNLEFESKLQTFVDIRDRIRDFSLDSHGFQILQRPIVLDPSSYLNRDAVESHYLPEVKQILTTIDQGYDKAFIFDWRVRNSATPREEVEYDMNDLTRWLRPSPTVHIDQSPRAVVQRVLLHLADEAAYLLQGRVRIINVWRPIENIVQDYPLAYCDPISVPETDLIECDHVRRSFTGANLYAHFNPGHQWYYLSEQRPDEVLLLKMFDSDENVKATRCPHASFRHPLSATGAKPRKSIEFY
ncbi:methyltransferase CmcJ [Thozetella sp. PMI_491]|nr:methyltransferase CmcJ [Thozetella sp. PMI_491]